jgi:hypothetical protein
MATYTGTRKSSSRRQLVVVGAAVLALGVMAGLGAWWVGLHQHNGSMAAHVETQAQPQDGSQPSSLPATSSVPTAASSAVATQTPHLYLVGSQEQAQAVDDGRFPFDDTVLVVSLEASPDEVTWLLNTMNEARRLQGLAALTVVDLRTPVAAAVPQQSPPGCPVLGLNSGNC